MNYNSNDILKMIQEGKSVDDIAKEFTAALNEAKKIDEAKRAELRRKEEEARKKAQEKVEKIADMIKVRDAIAAYIKRWYPNLTAQYKDLDITAEDLVDLVDDSIAEVREAFSMFGNVANMLKPGNATLSIKTDKSNLDNVFNTFFKNNGI